MVLYTKYDPRTRAWIGLGQDETQTPATEPETPPVTETPPETPTPTGPSQEEAPAASAVPWASLSIFAAASLAVAVLAAKSNGMGMSTDRPGLPWESGGVRENLP